MKCTIPEISWHNREPVLSVDIHPISEKFYRLATGGADCHVLIWQLNICDNGAVKIEALSDLTRHQKAVNSVCWAPGGQYLATADDDANIIIWHLKTDNIPLLEGETSDKEIWIVHKVMRGHKEDIYDLCWSPNGQKLLSGSIDNTAILWDFAKGKSEHILTDHKGFVQGVCWDPKSHYIATISTDRICRIYESNGKQGKVRIQRGYLPVPEDHYLYNKEVKFFHDDTFKSFFRRLDFSPDGTLLAVPSGRIEIEDCKKILNATYIFAVDAWTGPIAVFPSAKQCSTVVRFCPILFELHEDGPEPIFSLPFRMIFAVGTDHDVILYDTQQIAPFAYFKDIHYTRLTDLTWSKDGLLLVASSTDGFCALITFEPDELGVQFVKEESEAEDSVLNLSGLEDLDKDENELDISKEKNAEVSKPKKPNLLEQWTIKTPKRKINPEETVVKYTNESNKSLTKSINDKTGKKEVDDNKDDVIKRIKPIPVISEKPTADNEIVNPSVKQKVSPLVNFLKNNFTNTINNSKKTSPVCLQPVILDEVEARDAWKCEKNENKCSAENANVMDVSEYTEEFSLHLDDTTETSKIQGENNTPESNIEDKHKVMQEWSIDDTEKINEDCHQIKNTETKNEENLSTEVQKNANNTVQENDDTDTKKSCVYDTDNAHLKNEIIDKPEDCVKSTKVPTSLEDSNKIQQTSVKTENSSNQKTNVPTKRRIPLITLSSPKHKKK